MTRCLSKLNSLSLKGQELNGCLFQLFFVGKSGSIEGRSQFCVTKDAMSGIKIKARPNKNEIKDLSKMSVL